MDLPLPNSNLPFNNNGINLVIDPDLALLGWNEDWEIGINWNGSQAVAEEDGEVDLGSGVLDRSLNFDQGGHSSHIRSTLI